MRVIISFINEHLVTPLRMATAGRKERAAELQGGEMYGVPEPCSLTEWE
jgi:hypothetical protein